MQGFNASMRKGKGKCGIRFGLYNCNSGGENINVFDVIKDVESEQEFALFQYECEPKKLGCIILSSFHDKYTFIMHENKFGLHTYVDYAKHILNHMKEYQNILKESARIKMIYEVSQKEYERIKENYEFIKFCFNTKLKKYKDLTIACFQQKKSIRKFASEKLMNRGTVEFLRNQLIANFAKLLQERDEKDNRNQLEEENEQPTCLVGDMDDIY